MLVVRIELVTRGRFGSLDRIELLRLLDKYSTTRNYGAQTKIGDTHVQIVDTPHTRVFEYLVIEYYEGEGGAKGGSEGAGRRHLRDMSELRSNIVLCNITKRLYTMSSEYTLM